MRCAVSAFISVPLSFLLRLGLQIDDFHEHRIVEKVDGFHLGPLDVEAGARSEVFDELLVVLGLYELDLLVFDQLREFMLVQEVVLDDVDDRDDSTFEVGAGFDYSLYKFITLGAGYTYISADSNINENDYDDQLASVRIRGLL